MKRHVFARQGAKKTGAKHALQPAKPFRYVFPAKLEGMLKESRDIVAKLLD
jgi:hypothetical protein